MTTINIIGVVMLVGGVPRGDPAESIFGGERNCGPKGRHCRRSREWAIEVAQ